MASNSKKKGGILSLYSDSIRFQFQFKRHLNVYAKRRPFCVYAFGCFWRAILAVPPLLGGVAGVVLGRLGVGLPLAQRPCSCGARVRLTENLDAAASKFLRGLCGAVPLPARPLNCLFFSRLACFLSQGIIAGARHVRKGPG